MTRLTLFGSATSLLSAMLFTLVISGCKERSVSKVRVRDAVSALNGMVAEGSLESYERENAAAGIKLLENGVRDETPLIVMARLVPPSDQSGSHLVIKYISEVYSGGSLEIMKASGTWTTLKAEPEHPFNESDLYLRHLLLRSDDLTKLFPGSPDQLKGMKVRFVLAGKASNVVNIR